MKSQNLKAAGCILACLTLCVLLPGCSPRENQVTQFSTIDALLAGSYDGFADLQELDRAGNLGIGTFDKLNGEMILLDDEFWQARADGKIIRMEKNATTPFASVCEFSPDLAVDLQPQPDMDSLSRALDSICEKTNGIYAVKITGEFNYVKTRSVPAQQKPYPPLIKVTENQPEFEIENSTGTIIGFRLPPYVKGINVPGWHLHYLSDDKSFGGHLLQLNLKKAVCQVDNLTRLTLELDKTGRSMADIDMTIDRTDELKKVEGTR